MLLHRFKKKLIELGHEDFVEQVQNELMMKRNSTKKPRKLRNKQLNYTPIRVAFKLAYVGVNYQGLESQIDSTNTIETQLFKALTTLKMIVTREDCNYHRAGRTDKGVSSLGNVIALNIRKMGREDELSSEYLNRVLPMDIQILNEAVVDSTFNARYDCIKRIYKYYFFRGHYNLDAMADAMKLFIGSHDFRNFCKLDVIANQNFVRTIMNIELNKVDIDQSPEHYELFQKDRRLELYCITIEGNAFLWHQIRYMMSVLFRIGKGEETTDVITQLLLKFDGRPNYELAPDYPLVLFDCKYKQSVFLEENQKSHINLFAAVYERIREKLSTQYIEFLHFYHIGLLVTKYDPEATLEQAQKPKESKIEKKSILQHKTDVTVQNAIDNLKGKRKEKYNIKMQKVQEYKDRVLQKQQQQQSID